MAFIFNITNFIYIFAIASIDHNNYWSAYYYIIIIIIIIIIIKAAGIVTRSLRKNLEDTPGKHSIDSLQKTTILGTSHVIIIIIM